MREIKFRAWDLKAERMVQEPYYFDVYNYSDENRVNKETYRYYEDWRSLEDGRAWECELMQFTGLKDKNGKEIYEGDIIKSTSENVSDENMVVSWKKHLASFGLKRSGWMFTHYFGEAVEPENCEVIGNIYENPELLN